MYDMEDTIEKVNLNDKGFSYRINVYSSRKYYIISIRKKSFRVDAYAYHILGTPYHYGCSYFRSMANLLKNYKRFGAFKKALLRFSI